MVSISRAFSLVLPILISSLLIPTAVSEDSSLLQKFCIDSHHNNTITYASNLKNLLDDLYNNTSQDHGFMNTSWGQGPDQVYGLALCRGDVSTDDCEDCLYDARCKITRRCDKQKAIVQYDYCQLKYSDDDFFGKIDTDNDLVIVMVNIKNVNASEAERFNATAIGLLSGLSEQASDNKYMFARGEEILLYDDNNKNMTIYGMAQCSRDLSRENCKDCLDWAVKEKLPINKGKPYSVGARVVAPSCIVRYEIYTFLKDWTSV